MQTRQNLISELPGEPDAGERWAVAIEGGRAAAGLYTWVRDEKEDIAVFGSKTDAQLWVLSGRDFLHDRRDVVFVKLP